MTRTIVIKVSPRSDAAHTLDERTNRTLCGLQGGPREWYHCENLFAPTCLRCRVVQRWRDMVVEEA